MATLSSAVSPIAPLVGAPRPGDLEPRRWLLALRWMAVPGQLLAILFAYLESPTDPLAAPLALVGLLAASNLALWWRARAQALTPRTLAFVLLFDVGLLATTLALAGGPANPMSALLLVHVALAAVVLGRRWAWVIAVAAIGAFGALFIVAPCHVRHGPLHLQGMWLAFTLAALTIVAFVSRVTAELRDREARLRDLAVAKAKSDRLAALSTLAAGAAHELATPLGTIAIAATELARSPDLTTALADDARLIRREVDRCRTILETLSLGAGEARGDGLHAVPLPHLADDVLATLSPEERSRVVVSAPDMDVTLPRLPITQALRTLIRNGLDASDGAVHVSLRRSPREVELCVEDTGIGMTPDVLAKAGEPFFTTKPEGKGLGLGLFLARGVAERLGGALTLDSRLGQGTRVALRVPLAAP